MSGHAPDAHEQRLVAIEEHAAFTERAVEQLSSEIAELGKRVRALAARLEALDERLKKAVEPPTSTNPEAPEP